MKKLMIAVLLLAGCQHVESPDFQLDDSVKEERVFTTTIDTNQRVMIVRRESDRSWKGTIVREFDGVCEEAQYGFERWSASHHDDDKTKYAMGFAVSTNMPKTLISHWSPSSQCSKITSAGMSYSLIDVLPVLMARGPRPVMKRNYGMVNIPMNLLVGTNHIVLPIGDSVGLLVDLSGAIRGISVTGFDEGFFTAAMIDESDYKTAEINLKFEHLMEQFDLERERYLETNNIQNISNDATYGRAASEAFATKTLTDLGAL